MNKEFLETVVNLAPVQRFIAKPSPKWMVFLADLIVVVLSCLCSFAFGSPKGTEGSGLMVHPSIRCTVAVCVYAVFLLLFGTSRYIIRLSVIEDSYRLIQLVVTSSVVLTIITLICYITEGYLYFRIWTIFNIAVIAFALMLIMRLSIKFVYLQMKGVSKLKKRVVVLGSALNSFFLARALRNEFEGSFEPVVLLSLDPGRLDNKVNGIPIEPYKEDGVEALFERYDCDTLLFLSTLLEVMRSGMADVFLRNGIKLLMLNQVEEFDVNSKSTPAISKHVQDVSIEDLLGREPIHIGHDSAIGETIKGQTVMITGAAGSIGSEIVRQVAAMGASDIVLFDQAETPMHDMQLEMEARYPQTKIHLYIGDVANYERVEHAFRKYHPRFVYHAAAYKHVPMMEHNPAEAVLTNVFGTKNVADLSVKYGVEKFVMISTDKAVNPTNVMGASKRIAEIYVQSLFFHERNSSDGPTTAFITTRFGNVLGSNGSVIPLFRKQIEAGGPVTVTDRNIIRYFMTIREACSLVLEAGCMGRGGEIFVFDMGQPVKIWDLAVRMISLSGLKVDKDIEIVETGLRPGEKLYEELLSDKEKTLPTSHRRIMISRVRMYKYEDVCVHLARLSNMLHTECGHDIVAEMKHIVPEFKSNNSKWQEVDTEIAGGDGEASLETITPVDRTAE